MARRTVSHEGLDPNLPSNCIAWMSGVHSASQRNSHDLTRVERFSAEEDMICCGSPVAEAGTKPNEFVVLSS